MNYLTPNRVQTQLRQFSQSDLRQPSIDLFELLGIFSEQIIELSGLREFSETVLSRSPNFSQKQAYWQEWKQVHLLFHLTGDDEVEDTESLYQAYVFMAIDLIQTDYTKTKLASISKQVNRLFPDPVFCYFVINKKLHSR